VFLWNISHCREQAPANIGYLNPGDIILPVVQAIFKYRIQQNRISGIEIARGRRNGLGFSKSIRLDFLNRKRLRNVDVAPDRLCQQDDSQRDTRGDTRFEQEGFRIVPGTQTELLIANPFK
jgi:hypothetical protein